VTDHHHDVAGNIDEIADREVAQFGQPTFVSVGLGEIEPVQCRCLRLVARVARQLDAEAAIDLGYEAAAVARIVRVTPAVALAQELESLA
jgi:hypothetical protein